MHYAFAFLLSVQCYLSWYWCFCEWLFRANVLPDTHTIFTGLIDVGRGSSIGIATSNGLDGPGIECQWPIGLRQGSAADRLLGLRVRMPPGAWMFLLCVIYSKDKKAKIHDNQDREVRVKYRQRTKNIPLGARVSAPVHTGFGSHLASCKMGN